MSRKFWVISAVAAGALVVLGLAAVGGYFLYRQNQTRQWLAKANEAFEKSDGNGCSALRVLSEREQDIGASSGRPCSLHQAGIAGPACLRPQPLSQSAYDPSQQDAQGRFELQKKLGAWHEVHYFSQGECSRTILEPA